MLQWSPVSEWATMSTLPLFSLEVKEMLCVDCIEVEASESSLTSEALSCAEYWAVALKSTIELSSSRQYCRPLPDALARGRPVFL